MRKFLMSSILAALASCRPGKMLTGSYVQKVETTDVVLKDTLILSRNGDRRNDVNIERRAAFFFKEGVPVKDTTMITNVKGEYDPKEKLIRTEDGNIRVKPKRRELQRAQWTYRRISR